MNSEKKIILCVITTSFQLTCVVEYLKLINNNIPANLVIITEDIKSKNLFEFAKNKYKDIFSEINIINTGVFDPRNKFIKSILDTIKTKKLINEYKKNNNSNIKEIVAGHAPPYAIGYFLSKFNEDITIVDDGLRSLTFLTEKKFREKDINLNHNFLSAGWILKFLYGKNGEYQRNSTYFTIFSDEADKDIKCIKNNLTILSEKKSRNQVQVQVQDSHHFLGQPLIENNILSSKNYITAIKEISDKLNNLTYYAHPTENHTNLNLIKEIGVNVIKLDCAYEDFLMSSNTLPRSIGSFYSSAIIVLSKIIPNKISLYYVNSTEKFENYNVANQVNRIYDALKNCIIIIDENKISDLQSIEN